MFRRVFNDAMSGLGANGVMYNNVYKRGWRCMNVVKGIMMSVMSMGVMQKISCNNKTSLRPGSAGFFIDLLKSNSKDLGGKNLLVFPKHYLI